MKSNQRLCVPRRRKQVLGNGRLCSMLLFYARGLAGGDCIACVGEAQLESSKATSNGLLTSLLTFWSSGKEANLGN